MAMETKDFHQELMDKAYDLWRTHKDWSYPIFIDNLDMVSRRAVVLGNLNYQVCNGGFTQWEDNQYMENSGFVLKAVLTDIQGKLEYNELQKALELAEKYRKEADSCVRDEDNENTSLGELEDELCKEFYALSKLEEQMKMYLISIY
jgi:hypothetical protein